MRRTIAAAVILAASLTACDSNADNGGKKSKPQAASSSFDCTLQTSQAEWTKHCADEVEEPAAEQASAGLTFGKMYRWPDGLEISVTAVRQVTKFGEYDTRPDPSEVGFRVELKLTNKGKASTKLDDLSIITEGATNGGEASATTYNIGSEPLEGRLAPGVSVVKNDDGVLGKQYGNKIVVVVQRSSKDFGLEFPEFTGTIQ